MFAGLIPMNEPFSQVQIWNVIYTAFKIALEIYFIIYGNIVITEPIHILVLCKEILGIHNMKVSKTRDEELCSFIYNQLKNDVSDEEAKQFAFHLCVFVVSLFETQHNVFQNIIPFTRFHYFLE
jgi:hypothetical protein